MNPIIKTTALCICWLAYQPIEISGKLVSYAFKRTSKKPRIRLQDIPASATSKEGDDVWPPPPHAVKVLSVEELMAANGTLIRNLCFANDLDDEETEQYLLPVIVNLARIVHQVPASQFDHHQGYGGLFTHSLETALAATNIAKNKIFDRSAPPKDQHFNKARWVLVAALAGLAHDIGKPYSDMEITDSSGRTWDQSKPLLDWLTKHKIKSYNVAYKDSRDYNQHREEAHVRSMDLIPEKTWMFIGLTGYGREMRQAFNKAILHGADSGLIGQILELADGESRFADVTRQRHIHPAFKNVAHPQANQILRAIRALLESKQWTVNKSDSRVFDTRKGCFIAWSEKVALEIRNQAVEMGDTSLPIDYIRMASILVDGGVARRNTDDISNTHNMFWRITPIVLGNVQLDCLLLTDPLFIFDTTRAGIETIVEGQVIEDVTKDAWMRRWQFVPVQKLTRLEEEAYGYTEDYVAQLAREAKERENERNEMLAAEVGIPVEDWDEATMQPADSSSTSAPQNPSRKADDGINLQALMPPPPAAAPVSVAAAADDRQAHTESVPTGEQTVVQEQSDLNRETPDSTSFVAPESETELEMLAAVLPAQQQTHSLAFFNEPVSPQPAAPVVEYETKAEPGKQQTALAEKEVLTSAMPPAAQGSAKIKSGSRKKDVLPNGERLVAIARDMASHMARQMQMRSGDWVAGGIRRDAEKGCLCADAEIFESVLVKEGINESIVRFVLQQAAESMQTPRIEWDASNHRIFLIES